MIHNLDQRDKQVLRTMMGKLRNIKKVGYQLAHHLSGIVLIIVGKGQFFIMVKQLLSHIPLHLCSHHMA